MGFRWMGVDARGGSFGCTILFGLSGPSLSSFNLRTMSSESIETSLGGLRIGWEVLTGGVAGRIGVLRNCFWFLDLPLLAIAIRSRAANIRSLRVILAIGIEFI